MRQLVGYDRFEGEESCGALAALYEMVRLYTNFFQHCMKLVSKERLGSKVKKTYDDAKTPYQRVLESAAIREEVKEALRTQYLSLNPVALLRQMEQGQACLWKQAKVRLTNEATIPSK